MSKREKRRAHLRLFVLAILLSCQLLFAFVLWRSPPDPFGVAELVAAAALIATLFAFMLHVYDAGRFRWALFVAGIAGVLVMSLLFMHRLNTVGLGSWSAELWDSLLPAAIYGAAAVKGWGQVREG